MSRLLVGLTGGIATGKTTVLAEFRRAGAATVSTDELAHELLREPGVSRKVARRWGREMLGADGAVDRKKLGARVFSDKKALAALERLLHPEIKRRALRAVRASRRPVAVVDVPLLFEKGLEKGYDLTVAVYSSESEQRRRLKRRDKMGEAMARRRIGLQLPIDEKCRRADVVIDNSRPWPKVRPVVREYYKAFELLAHGAGK